MYRIRLAPLVRRIVAMIPKLVVTLTCIVPGADPIEWPALVQKPYAGLPVPDLGLRPLLRTREGEKITTRQGWEEARQGLRESWLKHLGPSPEKPAKLDVRIEKTEQLDGYTRQLLSFVSEGDDRIGAYLLVPDGLRPKERRPVVVVFHQTTRETLKEPVGLDQKNPDLALALHLVKRGYIRGCWPPNCEYRRRHTWQGIRRGAWPSALWLARTSATRSSKRNSTCWLRE